MKKKPFIVKALKKSRNMFRLHVLRDPQLLAHRRWVRARGESTLRLDYPLDAGSVVVDLGAFRGDFAEAIHARYGCAVYLFEPVREFFELCEKRFAGEPKVRCFNYGLMDSDGEMFISDEDNASSLVRSGPGKGLEAVQVRDFLDTMDKLGIGKIDLLKMNIEGGEYLVLPHLIQGAYMEKIRFLQVQFHAFIPGAAALREKIRTDLARTHRESWNYAFVWESWVRL